MRISADHVVRLAGNWTSEAGSGAELRSEPRLAARGTATVAVLHGDSTAPEFGARIYDISAGGVGIIMHQPVCKGERLCVTLPSQDDTHSVRIICTVRYVRMTGDRMYRVGAGFVCVALDELPSQPQSFCAAAAD